MDLTNVTRWTASVNAALCRLMILREVCRKPGHGYALVQRIARRTRRVCTPTEATIYPTLAELERSGYLTVSDCPVNRRARKIYTATPMGREACRIGTRIWREALQGIFGPPLQATSSHATGTKLRQNA